MQLKSNWFSFSSWCSKTIKIKTSSPNPTKDFYDTSQMFSFTTNHCQPFCPYRHRILALIWIPRPACPTMQGCIIHMEQKLVKIISILCNCSKGSFVGGCSTCDTQYTGTLSHLGPAVQKAPKAISRQYSYGSHPGYPIIYWTGVYEYFSLIKCISRARRN